MMHLGLILLHLTCIPHPYWQLDKEYGDIKAVFIDALYNSSDSVQAGRFRAGELSQLKRTSLVKAWEMR